MKRKKTGSMDGFVPRYPRSDGKSTPKIGGEGSSRPILGEATNPITSTSERPSVGSVSRSEVDASLAGIDVDESTPKKRHRGIWPFRRNKNKPRTRKQRIIRRLIKIFIIAVVLLLVFLLVRGIISGSRALDGNLFGFLQNKPLQMDANGRSNILLFGTSEDDPGHEAAYLTDSIMVISIDQNAKNAYMVSLPRDLYVDYGAACNAGFQGKINELYGCYSDGGKKSQERDGANALQKKAGSILGLDVQYYAHVNYSVVRDVVKALDGITVTIDSRDPRGVMDSNFDWKCKGGNENASLATMTKNCPPSGHFIDYPNGPAKLDAEHALYLAQARGDRAPTYGLEQSNFDREKNQQKIIKAIREKAVSAGTLTNVGKVTGLMDAIGNNLRTNFETAEVRTLMQIGQDISDDKIVQLSLVDEGNELVGSTDLGGISAVVPSAGTYDYSGIQAFIAKKLSKNPVIREGANVVVLNATTVEGLALTQGDILTKAGYTVVSSGNAPEGSYGNYSVYQLTKGNQGTKNALAKRYSVEVKQTDPPIAVASGTDFVVVIGKAPSQDSAN